MVDTKTVAGSPKFTVLPDGDFLMSPRDAEDARGGERALALVRSWVDRFCPEHLDQLQSQRRTKK